MFLVGVSNTDATAQRTTVAKYIPTQLDADYIKYVMYNEIFPIGAVYLSVDGDAPSVEGITWEQVDEGYIIASAINTTKKYESEYWNYDPSTKCFVYTSSSVQYALRCDLESSDAAFKLLYNAHYITSSNDNAFYLDTGLYIVVITDDEQNHYEAYMSGDILCSGDVYVYHNTHPYDPTPTYFVDGSGIVNVYNYGVHFTLNYVNNANEVLCMLYNGDVLVSARNSNTFYYTKFNIFDVVSSGATSVSSKKINVLEDSDASAYYDFSIELDTTDKSETITGSAIVKLSDANGHTHTTRLAETLSGGHTHTVNASYRYEYNKGSYDANNDSSTTKQYNWNTNTNPVIMYRESEPDTTYHEMTAIESTVASTGSNSTSTSHTHSETVMYLEKNNGGGYTAHNHEIETTIPVVYVKAWVRTDKNNVNIPDNINIKDNDLYKTFVSLFLPSGTVLLTATPLENSDGWSYLSSNDFILVSGNSTDYNYNGNLYATSSHILEKDEIPKHTHTFRSESVSEENISTTYDIEHLHEVPQYKSSDITTVQVATNTNGSDDNFPISRTRDTTTELTLETGYSGLHTHDVSVESIPTNTGSGHSHTLNYKYLSVYVYVKN